MASLDSLPADQRAVLQLVLQRGRSYDAIAALLSIDRAGVRQRALTALDALGPQTGVAQDRRALITDYLLGQLPAQLSEQTREHLAQSASERAWARVVASELSAIAAKPLPEVPVESTSRVGAPVRDPAAPEPVAPEQPIEAPAEVAAAATPKSPPPPGERGPREPGLREGRRSSLLGGAALLVIALIVIVVAVILIAGGGGSKHKSSTTANAATSTSATTAPQVVRQINLTSPSPANSKLTGLADVLKQGTTEGIAIIAQNVPPNTKHDAYAVWLYNSPSDSHILGFVNPGVGANRRLSTAGPLPANASHYRQLIVTLETQANPSAPGTIILQGPFTLS
jgi:hypothetical protein